MVDSAVGEQGRRCPWALAAFLTQTDEHLVGACRWRERPSHTRPLSTVRPREEPSRSSWPVLLPALPLAVASLPRSTHHCDGGVGRRRRAWLRRRRRCGAERGEARIPGMGFFFGPPTWLDPRASHQIVLRSASDPDRSDPDVFSVLEQLGGSWTSELSSWHGLPRLRFM